MKMFFLTSIAIIFYQTSFCQKTALSAERSKILYYGIDNPLSIVVENYSCNQIEASVENGEIKRVTPCHYIFFADHIGKASFNVYLRRKGIREKVAHYECLVKEIPPPITYIGNQNGDKICKNILLAQQGIYCHFPSNIIACLEAVRTIVKKYTMIITHEEKLLFIESYHDAYFSEPQKEIFKSLKHGDKIIITNIQAMIPSGKLINLAPVEFEIEE